MVTSFGRTAALAADEGPAGREAGAGFVSAAADAAAVAALAEESSEWMPAPVLARLCCCFSCSLSEGERERFRVVSCSAIARVMISIGVCFSDFSAQARGQGLWECGG